MGEVLTLHHLNDDIPESVVSKMVAEEKAGMVTNLTFSPDKDLSAHTAPFHALVQIPE